MGKQKIELSGSLLVLPGQSRLANSKGYRTQPEERDRGVSACASVCVLGEEVLR